MTYASAWDYTDTVTVWPVTIDKYSQETPGTAVVHRCSWRQGGRLMRDDAGAEFITAVSVYLEAATEDAPRVGWFMAIGTHASKPSDAVKIRSVQGFNNNTFADGLPDWVVGV